MAKPPDPRLWVSPDDLNVSPEVLGLPLATPTRRAMAMLLDLAAIALLSSLANVWMLAALALVGIAHVRKVEGRRAPRRPWLVQAAVALLVVAGGLQAWQDLQRPKRSADSAVADALADAAVQEMEARVDRLTGQADEPEEPSAASSAAAAANAVLAAASAGGPASAAALSKAERRALVATATMGRALARQAERIRTLEARLDETRRMQSFDPRAWIKHWADDVGLGYGFALVYFSLLPAWWRGQTLGKRALGLRVVELTGKPMTALRCLKRFGGYAAGMATGGLGLVQLLWDSNRQAIQDKTAHTAVIDLRRTRRRVQAPPAPLPDSALSQPAVASPVPQAVAAPAVKP